MSASQFGASQSEWNEFLEWRNQKRNQHQTTHQQSHQAPAPAPAPASRPAPVRPVVPASLPSFETMYPVALCQQAPYPPWALYRFDPSVPSNLLDGLTDRSVDQLMQALEKVDTVDSKIRNIDGELYHRAVHIGSPASEHQPQKNGSVRVSILDVCVPRSEHARLHALPLDELSAALAKAKSEQQAINDTSPRVVDYKFFPAPVHTPADPVASEQGTTWHDPQSTTNAPHASNVHALQQPAIVRPGHRYPTSLETVPPPSDPAAAWCAFGDREAAKEYKR